MANIFNNYAIIRNKLWDLNKDKFERKEYEEYCTKNIFVLFKESEEIYKATRNYPFVTVKNGYHP